MLLLITTARVWSIYIMHHFETQLIPPVVSINKLTLVNDEGKK